MLARRAHCHHRAHHWLLPAGIDAIERIHVNAAIRRCTRDDGLAPENRPVGQHRRWPPRLQPEEVVDRYRVRAYPDGDTRRRRRGDHYIIEDVLPEARLARRGQGYLQGSLILHRDDAGTRARGLCRVTLDGANLPYTRCGVEKDVPLFVVVGDDGRGRVGDRNGSRPYRRGCRYRQVLVVARGNYRLLHQSPNGEGYTAVLAVPEYPSVRQDQAGSQRLSLR